MVIGYQNLASLPGILDLHPGKEILHKRLLQHHITNIFFVGKQLVQRSRAPLCFPGRRGNVSVFQFRGYLSEAVADIFGIDVFLLCFFTASRPLEIL